jgi:hypothetical protein
MTLYVVSREELLAAIIESLDFYSTRIRTLMKAGKPCDLKIKGELIDEFLGHKLKEFPEYKPLRRYPLPKPEPKRAYRRLKTRE